MLIQFDSQQKHLLKKYLTSRKKQKHREMSPGAEQVKHGTRNTGGSND